MEGMNSGDVKLRHENYDQSLEDSTPETPKADRSATFGPYSVKQDSVETPDLSTTPMPGSSAPTEVFTFQAASVSHVKAAPTRKKNIPAVAKDLSGHSNSKVLELLKGSTSELGLEAQKHLLEKYSQLQDHVSPAKPGASSQSKDDTYVRDTLKRSSKKHSEHLHTSIGLKLQEQPQPEVEEYAFGGLEKHPHATRKIMLVSTTNPSVPAQTVSSVSPPASPGTKESEQVWLNHAERAAVLELDSFLHPHLPVERKFPDFDPPSQLDLNAGEYCIPSIYEVWKKGKDISKTDSQFMPLAHNEAAASILGKQVGLISTEEDHDDFLQTLRDSDVELQIELQKSRFPFYSSRKHLSLKEGLPSVHTASRVIEKHINDLAPGSLDAVRTLSHPSVHQEVADNVQLACKLELLGTPNIKTEVTFTDPDTIRITSCSTYRKYIQKHAIRNKRHNAPVEIRFSVTLKREQGVWLPKLCFTTCHLKSKSGLGSSSEMLTLSPSSSENSSPSGSQLSLARSRQLSKSLNKLSKSVEGKLDQLPEGVLSPTQPAHQRQFSLPANLVTQISESNPTTTSSSETSLSELDIPPQSLHSVDVFEFQSIYYMTNLAPPLAAYQKLLASSCHFFQKDVIAQQKEGRMRATKGSLLSAQLKKLSNSYPFSQAFALAQQQVQNKISEPVPMFFSSLDQPDKKEKSLRVPDSKQTRIEQAFIREWQKSFDQALVDVADFSPKDIPPPDMEGLSEGQKESVRNFLAEVEADRMQFKKISDELDRMLKAKQKFDPIALASLLLTFKTQCNALNAKSRHRTVKNTEFESITSSKFISHYEQLKYRMSTDSRSPIWAYFDEVIKSLYPVNLLCSQQLTMAFDNLMPEPEDEAAAQFQQELRKLAEHTKEEDAYKTGLSTVLEKYGFV